MSETKLPLDAIWARAVAASKDGCYVEHDGVRHVVSPDFAKMTLQLVERLQRAQQSQDAPPNCNICNDDPKRFGDCGCVCQVPQVERCPYHGTTFEECAKRSREVYGYPEGFEPCRVAALHRAEQANRSVTECPTCHDVVQPFPFEITDEMVADALNAYYERTDGRVTYLPYEPLLNLYPELVSSMRAALKAAMR